MKKSDIKAIYSLSPMQEGMLFQARMDGDSAAYFEQMDITISGDIRRELLEKTLKRLVERYDVLRTVFTYKKTKIPRQVLLKTSKLDIRTRDFTLLDVNQKEAALREYKETDRLEGFDLSKGPLMRLALLKTASASYHLIWSYHHILMDGWCFGILLREFMEIYTAQLKGDVATFPPAVPYNRYIQWLEKQAKGKGLDFWARYLGDYNETASVPKRSSQIMQTGYRQGKSRLRLDEALSGQLKELLRQTNVTAGMFFQVVWGLLLQRYNFSSDVVFGVIVSGRPPEIPGIDNMVGLFINTVPVRITCGAGQTFSDLLGEMRTHFIAARSYEYLPLAEIQAQSQLKGQLLDHLLVFENYPMETAVEQSSREDSAAFRVEGFQMFEQIGYPLDLTIAAGDRPLLEFTFNSLLYDPEFIDATVTRLRDIIGRVAANPHIAVKDISIVTASQQKQILEEFNAPVTHTHDGLTPGGLTLHGFMESQTLRKPDRIAARARHRRPGSFEDRWMEITYGALDRCAGELASLLQKKGVTAGSIVAVITEPSVEMLMALLGILKAGGSYLPIDPAAPGQRIDYILADCSAKLVITDLRARVEIPANIEQIALTTPTPNESSQSPPFTSTLNTVSPTGSENIPSTAANTVNTNDPAYVIYTSGTTGKPKGVMVEHRNAAAYVQAFLKEFRLDKGDVLLQQASYTFDAFVEEVYPLLAVGGRLIVSSRDQLRDIDGFAAMLFAHRVSIISCTPLLLNQLNLKEPYAPHLRIIISGGDVLKSQHVSGFIRKTGEPGTPVVYNTYGPSETTVCATYYRCTGKELPDSSISIGHPVGNYRVYILDRNGFLLPSGVPGEISIAGAGVARGYLNRPQLTADCFFDWPLTGERLYRSGDLGRQCSDGSIEFLGRIDQQVKIRGFRIELGEIEHCLLLHPEVREAVVIARDGRNGDSRLCAYLVPAAGCSSDTYDALRGFLSKHLPSYMIPAHFVSLEVFPQTVSGKIDKLALPDPGQESAAFVAPENETQMQIAEIWADVLELEKGDIGIDMNFFHAYGHSLSAMQMSSALYKTFGIQVPLPAIFQCPTIRELALHIMEARRNNSHATEGIPAAGIKEYYPQSSAQKRLFALSLLGAGTAYNMPTITRPGVQLDSQLLESIFSRLIQRHEALRTSFFMAGDQPVQKVHRSVEFSVETFSVEDEKGSEAIISAFIRPFDLSSAPLLRVGVIRPEGRIKILMVDIHHIVSDGVSVAILTREFGDLLEGKKLPPLSIHYKDYAVWQQEQLHSGALNSAGDFWLSRFKGELPQLALPYDYPGPNPRSFEGARQSHMCGGPLSDGLRTLAAGHDATLFMVIMALYHILLSRYAGQEDIIVGTVISGRTNPLLEPVIGMFVNTLAMRSTPGGEKTFPVFLDEIKEDVLLAFENQDYPFDRFIEKLDIRRDLSRSPLLDTLFVLQEEQARETGSPLLSPYAFEEKPAKFDLTLSVTPLDGDMEFSWEYCTRLFKKETIRRMACHFENLLRQVVSESTRTLHSIDIMSPAGKRQVLHQFNENYRPTVDTGSLHGLFERQASTSPASIALVGPQMDRAMTYGELDAAARGLALRLRAEGVEPGGIVALMANRSMEMIIAILAILKAGAAYLPIDPNYPSERIGYMLADSSAGLLLTDACGGPSAGNAKDPSRTGLIKPPLEPLYYFAKGYLNSWDGFDISSSTLEVLPNTTGVRTGGLPESVKGSAPAYIIYTSGTTGKPKGVVITHSNAVGYVRASTRLIALTPDDTRMQLASFSFDVFVEEVY
ncbi:MAG: amino acid adenylation domain-containing protein, partial [bacterium]|nr:amino acid adenylation domain-containing protein [bacterium]